LWIVGLSYHICRPRAEEDSDDWIEVDDADDFEAGDQHNDFDVISHGADTDDGDEGDDPDDDESAADVECICNNSGPADRDIPDGGTHAIHCWESDCDECKNRGSGVQPWKATEMPACKNSFTKGPTSFVQMYSQGHNIIALMPAADTMRLMKSSAKANKRFCSLKQALDPKLKETQYQMETLHAQMDDQEEEIKNAISDDRRDASEQSLQNMQDTFDSLEATSKELLQQLKEEEKAWMTTMRRLNDHIDSALVDSGVLEEIDGTLSEDEDYAHVGEEAEAVSCSSDDNMSEDSEVGGKGSKDPDASEEVAVGMELSAQHNQLKYTLEKAYDDVKAYGENYEENLAEYVQDQQSRDRAKSYKILVEEFKKRNVKAGQRLTARIKPAQQSLAKFEDDKFLRRIEIDTMKYHNNKADFAAEFKKEELLDIKAAKSKEEIKDWWSKTGGIDAIPLAETILDPLEESVNGGEEIVGSDNEAADLLELEVRDSS
jgi:hypothetical protein